ncbi:hypothetical protein EFP14_15375 [Lactiplantibacillus pentosus]|nr:hypothetical protein [Lactiplantibacillus pentosus]
MKLNTCKLTLDVEREFLYSEKFGGIVLEKVKIWIQRFKERQPVLFIVALTLMIVVFIPLFVQLIMYWLSFGIFTVATNDAWLGFWGGVFGAVIAIGGVVWQFTNTRKLEIYDYHERSRPKTTFGYRASLNEGEKVYFSLDDDDWITQDNRHEIIDPSLLVLHGNESPEFDESLRYDPQLLGFTNVSKMDLYYCSVVLEYYAGEETDRYRVDGVAFNALDQNKLSNEMHIERFEIPNIGAKETAIIAPWPEMHQRVSLFIKAILSYQTEASEFGEAIFTSKLDVTNENQTSIFKIPDETYSMNKNDIKHFSDRNSLTGYAKTGRNENEKPFPVYYKFNGTRISNENDE